MVEATALRGQRRLMAARAAIGQVMDPEIPGVAIVDLGMVHALREDGDVLVVELLPTFSGCPAIEVIHNTVRADLEAAGVGPVRVVTRGDLPWSTDMITPAGREQVRAAGLVPPQRGQIRAEEIACLNCGERAVVLVSRFGSTPCRATARCRACGEPLQLFKPIGTGSDA